MLGRIPQFIDFIRYTESRKTLKGSLSFKFCQRLAAQTENPDGVITFELDFGVDEFANRYVKGQLETKLILVCQRCMEKFDFPIQVDLALGFISTPSQEEKISGLYESYFYEDGPQIDLHALIEDEIILELPLIAKHEQSDCSMPSETHSATELESDETFIDKSETIIDKNETIEAQVEKVNPFDILKQLKN